MRKRSRRLEAMVAMLLTLNLGARKSTREISLIVSVLPLTDKGEWSEPEFENSHGSLQE